MNKTTIPRKNTIWVGADSGPSPLTDAKAAAVSGDTIIVTPGTYYANDLLKTGVNWHFMSGAKVIHDVSSANVKHGSIEVKAIFDDAGAEIISEITGDGEFHTIYGEADWDDTEALPITSNQNRMGFINISCATTELTVNFWRATYTGYASGGIEQVRIENCAHCSLKGESITTLNTSSSTQIGDGPSDLNGPYEILDCLGGIWWAQGETYIDVDVIKSGLYAVYAEGNGVSDASNLWVKSSLIEATNFATIYTNGSANANWKVWITAQEIRASGSNNAMNCQSNGKVYIDALKIGSVSGGVGTLVSFSATGAEYWVRAEKISLGAATNQGLLIGAPYGQNYPCKAFLSVQHYNDTTSGTPTVAPFISVNGTATECHILGGVMDTKQNTRGFNHISGALYLSNLRIVTNATNDADNVPITVAANGLVLSGCTLVPPALAPSISGAGVVKVYADSFTPYASNGVTFAAGIGALVVDTDVS